MTEAHCHLCKNYQIMKKSHFVPKFALKWIKKTSATGFTRDIKGIRKQDSYKKYFLCDECEHQFSIYEAYFARRFFYTLLNNQEEVRHIRYDERLLKFIVSLSWRIINKELDLIESIYNKVPPHIQTIINEWQEILTDPNKKTIDSHHYLIYWGNIDLKQISNQHIFSKFEYYINRAIDACYCFNDDHTIEYIYTQIPNFSIISMLNPEKFVGLTEVEIQDSGIYFSQFEIIDDKGFMDFLNSRVALIEKSSLSDRENKKLEELMLSDPKRTLESESFKSFLKRSNRIKNKTFFDYYSEFKKILERPETKNNNLSLYELLIDLKISDLIPNFEKSAFNVKSIKKSDENRIQDILKEFERYIRNQQD